MVKILTYTTDIPITMIGEMAGICYGTADITNHKKNFIRGIDCIRSRHGRTWEFPDIYMEISGYSARVIREFYTHIGGSPTRLQESTRYIDMTNFDYVVPPSIKTDEDKELYNIAISNIKETYNILKNKDVPKEDLAMLLPLGMETKIVVKMNLRTFVDMCSQRLCVRAYWEYRKLMKEIISALEFYSDEWKILSQKEKLFVSKCELSGFCTEKNGCGLYPKKKVLNIDYSDYLETLTYNDIKEKEERIEKTDEEEKQYKCMYCKDRGFIPHPGVKWVTICNAPDCQVGIKKNTKPVYPDEQKDTYIDGLSGRANYANERKMMINDE